MAPQSPEMAHVDYGGPRHPNHQQGPHLHRHSPALSHGTQNHHSPALIRDGYVPINSTAMNYGSSSFHGSNMNSPALQRGTHHGSSTSSPPLQHGIHHGSSMNSPALQHGTPTFNNGPMHHQSPSFHNSPLIGQTTRSPQIGSARLPNSARPDLRLPLKPTHESPQVRTRNHVQESPQLRHVSSSQGSPQLRNTTSPDSPLLNGSSAHSNKIKCVLIGDGAVGKTSLIISYTTNGYPNEYIPTAIDTYKAVVHVNGEAVTFELCDTPGQDDFDTLRPLVYPNTDVFVLCFSVVMPSTFMNVKEKWLPEVRSSCGKVPVVLVGTQSDLREDMKTLVGLAEFKEVPVPESDAKKLASSLGCVTYVESSSLTQKNLKDVFDQAIMAGLGFKTKTEAKKSKKKKKLCTIL